MTTRSRSRSAARLAAVQALYQQDMEGTPLPRLLKEFHNHRLGATIEDEQYHPAEYDFFDDIVAGADARSEEIDGLIQQIARKGTIIAVHITHSSGFEVLDQHAVQLVQNATLPPFPAASFSSAALNGGSPDFLIDIPIHYALKRS